MSGETRGGVVHSVVVAVLVGLAVVVALLPFATKLMLNSGVEPLWLLAPMLLGGAAAVSAA